MNSSGKSTFTHELKRTFALALPICSGHLSQMFLSLADTLMIGRVGVVPLAAAAFANSLHHFAYITGIGLMSAVSILVAHAYGGGRSQEAGEMLRRGLVVSFLGGVCLFLLQWSAFPFLGLLKQPVAVVDEGRPYLWLLSLSIPFALASITLKNYSEALNRPWPGFWCGLFSVALNIFLNWLLIYGNWGAPELGLTGAGIATAISRLMNVLILFLWLKCDKRFQAYWPLTWWTPVPLRGILAMLRLGFPVGMQLLMEIGAFGCVTLLMGLLGVIEIAAHQIAITCAATTFMVPLGLSMAVSIRVGHSIGEGDSDKSRRIGFSAMVASVILSLLFAGGFLLFGHQLAGLFTQDPPTLQLAARLILVAGLFQIFDGLQVVSMGALRGCKDVRFPTLVVFFAYWVLALPVGSYLAYKTDFAATGLWMGLMLGLAMAAFGLVLRFISICRSFVSRPY